MTNCHDRKKNINVDKKNVRGNNHRVEDKPSYGHKRLKSD